MADDFEDYIVEEPKRTKKGALKFQPDNADWSLDRLSEIQDFFQSTYKRPLPLTNKGQGSIHNRWGLDHRSSADVSLNPATAEGQALITELQRRNIPFLAFDRAIPGSSTGPHIHVGRPSSRTTGKFNVGAQVKRTKQQTGGDNFDQYVTADPDFDSYVVDQQRPAQPAQPAPQPRRPATPPRSTRPSFNTDLPTADIQAGIAEADRRQRAKETSAIATAVSDYEKGRTGSSNIGELRRQDQRELSARRQVEAQVRRERTPRHGFAADLLVSGPALGQDPITAIYDYARGKTEDQLVDEEVNRRLRDNFVSSERTRELVDQFTEEDKRQLADAVQRMRGMGPVSRGIETGSARVGAGLLYKLAGLSDLFVMGRGTKRLPGLAGPADVRSSNLLGEYLRRQAGRHELSIAEIEAEAPPEIKQQLADFVTHAVGALPEIAGTVAVAGPVGGFAALGGLETTGRKQSFGQIAKETAKGAALGATFKVAPAFETGAPGVVGRVTDTARSGAAIGLGTYGVEKAFGADDAQALRAAASNVLFHVGMKAPGEIGRFAQAAERALKTPPGEPQPTVPLELQERLSRAETTPAAMTPPAASPADNAATGSAVVVPPRTPAGNWRVQTPLPDGTISTKSFPTEAEARAHAAKTPEPMEMPSAEEVLPPSESLAQRPYTGSDAAQPFGERRVVPSGDPLLDAARSEGLRHDIEVVQVPEGFTVQRRSGENIGTVPDPTSAAALVRLAINESAVPPAEIQTPRPLPAEPVVGQIPEAPTTPSPKRPLADLMRERAETGPPVELGSVEGPRPVEPSRMVEEARRHARVEAGARELEQALLRRANQEPAEVRDLTEQTVDVPPRRKTEAESIREEVERKAAARELEPWRADADAFDRLRAEIQREHPDWSVRKVWDEAERRWPEVEGVIDLTNQPVDAGPPINLLTGKPIKKGPKGGQGEGGYIRVDEIAKAIRKVHEAATTKKGGRIVEYVLTQPGGRELAIHVEIDRRGVARPTIGPAEKTPDGRYSPDVTGVDPMHFGVDGILALKRYLMQVHPEVTRVQFERAGSTSRKFEMGRKVGPGGRGLKAIPRTAPERPAGWREPPRAVDLEAVRTQLSQRGFEVREVEGAPIPTFAVMKGPREVAKFASATRERALEQLDNYAKRTEGEGGFVDLNEILAGLDELRSKFPDKNERALRDMLPVNQRAFLDRERPLPHATEQPRTDTGQFAPGEPGGVEAARSQLRAEARKYAGQFKALDLHRARRDGLDIVNDDVAYNYFGQLRRMAAEYLPSRVEAIDRAEALYNRGKYGEATMLAEGVFRELPDKVNEYSGAAAAIQIIDEFGGTPKANWSKVLQEVRERLQRTGGLSGGGSTFYDVNKRPEGGRPDHEKIAYILEPVIEALKADASRLIAEGKIKAEGYVDHIRKAANQMLQSPEFADWHPLNKSAAMGVLVDRLRKEGPPPAAPPTTEAEPPAQRKRSLPPTLERSGRDPGTNLTYDRLPNRQVNERVEARLTSEGPEALETWYKSAPESAERTAAHRVLVDHYTAESVRLADTAPRRAEELYQRARDLSNLEAERATTMGQAVQMYSNLLKYSPPGVVRELAKAEAAGVKVPVELRRETLKAAQEHQRLDSEVKRLEKQLVQAEVEAAEAPAGSTSPRRYRPRGDTVVDSKAEAIRRKLDEAAQRRRAQKAFIAKQLRQLEQQQTASGYWKRAMNITRGLMVSQFQTAMRNLQSQAIRFDIERLVDATEHTIRRSVGLNSDLSYRNIARNTLRQFRPGQTPEAKELLKGHEAEYWRMFNTYAGGVEVPIPHKARTSIERVFQTTEKGVEVVNFFNRIQEHHVRSAEFLAELDLHLRKEKGQTLEQFVNRNGIDAIPLDLIRKGVDKALEVTFSDMPMRDGAGGRFLTSMIEVGNYIPPTLSPVAFPRFMFNNLKFLYQHSPAGMIDLARRNQNRPRVVARALVGTSMLLLAYQFRDSDHAGEKWYEIKLGDTTLDSRPFGPFSTYLFFAEALRRQLRGDKAFTTEEIAGAIGASTGPSGTAISVAEKLYDYAANGKWDKWQRVLKQEAGEWGRALLTPVRQVKDLIAAFDDSQAIMRDSSSEPFLGEIKESIPYADTSLPPAHKATTAAPIRQERPAAKAITGWRVITPKSFLEKQLDELNFKSSEILPSTGNRQADAVLKRVMGPLADELSAELERDPEFKRLSRAARGQLLREELKRVREEARMLAEEEDPELFDQIREERKPERQRKFEQELNSPGLSRATQLGVPMPIPPRQLNEDDIAYRARLLQVGRARRSKLDSVVGSLSANLAGQRRELYETLYS